MNCSKISILVCFAMVMACGCTQEKSGAESRGNGAILLEITSATEQVSVGEYVSFHARGDFNAAEVDLTEQVAWSTGNTAMASIDKKGFMHALQAGDVIVKASYNGKVFSKSIHIINHVTKTDLNLNVQFNVSLNRIELAWDAVENAQSYNVYWSSLGNEINDTFVQWVNTSDTTYVHEGLIADTTYDYMVTAVVDDVEWMPLASYSRKTPAHNVAYLAGEKIKGGSSLSQFAPQQRKTIKINGNDNPDLVYGDDFLILYGTIEQTSLVFNVLPVKNQSLKEVYCDIALEYNYAPLNGALVLSKPAQVTLTAYHRDSPYRSCLPPGYTGYFLFSDTIGSDQYGQIETLSISTLQSASYALDSTLRDPFAGSAAAVPQEYAVSDLLGDQIVSVAVKNLGSTTAKLGRESKYIVFDDADLPLMWGKLDQSDASLSDVLEPGSVTTISFMSGNDKPGTRVAVFTDFSPP